MSKPSRKLNHKENLKNKFDNYFLIPNSAQEQHVHISLKLRFNNF